MRIDSLEKMNQWLGSNEGKLVHHLHTDAYELLKEAETLRFSLEATLGEGFTIRGEGQDRSDFAQIEIPGRLLLDPSLRWVEVLLSNTAPLAAIREESKVQADALEVIKNVLEEVGYIVVGQRAFLLPPSKASFPGEMDGLWTKLFDFD